jgi:hypothetical protein
MSVATGMTISVIIAPPTAPQIPAPRQPEPPKPQLDSFELYILDVVRECEPLKLWQLLNMTSEEFCPRNREEGRKARLEVWQRVRRLIRLKLLFRVGRNEIVTRKSPPMPKERRVRRRIASVIKTASTKAVSTAIRPKAPESDPRPLLPQTERLVANHVHQQAQSNVPKSDCAPDPQSITAAARQMAKRPRKRRRRWTGWLHGEHCWRGRLVVLPDGEIAPLLWCNRGRVLLWFYRDMTFQEYLLWAGRREHDVRLYRTPEAVLLARRKTGKKERKSEAKARACRANGLKPCRPGKRRGRPRVRALP